MEVNKKITNALFLDVGRRIKQIRGKLRQSEFAEIIGVQQGTISVYEKGRIPEPLILQRIAEYGKTTVEWLLKGEGLAGQAGQAAANTASPEYAAAPYVSLALLEEIITAVEIFLLKKKKALPPKSKAFLIVLLYDHLWDENKDLTPELVESFCRKV